MPEWPLPFRRAANYLVQLPQTFPPAAAKAFNQQNFTWSTRITYSKVKKLFYWFISVFLFISVL